MKFCPAHIGKTAKVIGGISFFNTIVKIKVKIGDNIFYLHPMELKKIKGGNEE
ncbi:MAG: hypothetical protein ACTSSF_00230 [Candidatus Heimdallarchaeaceae archaeon]